MAESLPPTLMVLLTEDESGGRISVSLDGFMAFTEKLFADLDKLEEQWLPTSSPAARSSAEPAGRLRRATS